MTVKSKPSEQEIAIARVYAQAALSLAEAGGEADEVLAELAGLSDLMDRDPAFESFLGSPLVDTQERRAALDRMGRGNMSEILLDTLQVMNNKGRSGLVRALVEAYVQEYEALRQELPGDRLCFFLLEVGHRLPELRYLRHFLIAPRLDSRGPCP